MVRSDSLLPLGLQWRGADGRFHNDRRIIYRLERSASGVSGTGVANVTMLGELPEGGALHRVTHPRPVAARETAVAP